VTSTWQNSSGWIVWFSFSPFFQSPTCQIFIMPGAMAVDSQRERSESPDSGSWQHGKRVF
jgi:hypothetical protein